MYLHVYVLMINFKLNFNMNFNHSTNIKPLNRLLKVIYIYTHTHTITYIVHVYTVIECTLIIHCKTFK